MTVNDVPAWLNAMQVIAWHMLRDPAIVLRAASGGPDGIEDTALCFLWAERQPSKDRARPDWSTRDPFTAARCDSATWARAGRLPARATDANTGERRDLHTDAWARLDLAEVDDTGRAIDAFPVRRDGTVDRLLPRAWTDVRFERDALLRLCPAEPVRVLPVPTRVADPTAPFWTATEALTWLAFGTPETWEDLQARSEAFRHRWRAYPQCVGDVLRLLEARAGCSPDYAGPAYPWHPMPELGPSAFTSPYAAPSRWLEGPHGRFRIGAPELGRALRADHRRRLGQLMSYAELAAMLRVDLAEVARREVALDAAMRVLRNAIGTGTATALGVPASNPNTLPVAALPPVIASWPIQFRHDGVEPGSDATPAEHIEIRESARYVRVRFAAADIRVLLQQPSPDLETNPSAAERTETAGNIYRTGAPGRPSSKHLAVTELSRLFEEGQRWPSLTQAAADLSA